MRLSELLALFHLIMPIIDQLQITSFRNLAEISITPSRAVNLIHGSNGSGKTSVLEAIYVLSSGKSFRSALVDPLIKDGDAVATIYASTVQRRKFGLSKSRNKKAQLRLNGENQRNWDQVARALPALVIDSGAFELLEGGPKVRRRFLDWGVFHVEPTFLDNWRRAAKCIANRNRLLKRGASMSDELRAWDFELSMVAHEIDKARSEYFDKLLPQFDKIYYELAGANSDLKLEYRRGWPKEQKLEELLLNNRELDIRYGATQAGPHRSDIEIKVGSRKAIEGLSRGQEKLLVCALKIAQGELLSGSINRRCLYLVDDLPAELDGQNRQKVMKHLLTLGSQLFVTSVEPEAINPSAFGGTEVARFHVERGTIMT